MVDASMAVRTKEMNSIDYWRVTSRTSPLFSPDFPPAPVRHPTRDEYHKKCTGLIFRIALVVFVDVFMENEFLELDHQLLQFES